jgi:hypothetical protein
MNEIHKTSKSLSYFLAEVSFLSYVPNLSGPLLIPEVLTKEGLNHIY